MEGTKLDRLKAGTERLLGRTNERLKQKMGRSSESVISKDDKWQVITANFNRQQAAGLRLHREVKGYIASLKTLESSTQTLLDAVREMHEYTWPGNMNLVKALQGLDKLNKELNESMVDSLLVPVNNYIEVFSQMKVRMQKRERKLIDYTRAKRSLDQLKKGDKISPEKLGFAQDNFTQNKMVYEEVNSELCEDLPELWNSRKTYIMRFLDGFFSNSVDFHREFTQVYSESKDSLEPLKEQIRNDLPPQKEIGNVDRYFVVSAKARKFKRQSQRKSFRKSGSFKRSLSMSALKKSKKSQDTSQSISNISVDPYASPAQQATVYTPTTQATMKPRRLRELSGTSHASILTDNSTDNVNSSDATPYSPSINVEPGTVVECIHEYKAVDDDELSFGTGDVITVVAWDSVDEQDAGWFMGVLQGSGAKGAFPINYTRKYNRKKADPDPLEENFQTVDLSQDDEWRNNQQPEYINIPELPEEPALTNGTAHSGVVEVEPVEYSYPSAPPRLPPKRPVAPVLDTQVSVEVPELAAAVQAPEVEVPAPEVKVPAPEAEVQAPAAALDVDVEVEKSHVEVEAPAAAVVETVINVRTPEVAVKTPEVAVETPEVVKTPELAVETPELAVETSELAVEAPKVPAANMEVDVAASGAVEGAAAAEVSVEVVGQVETEAEVEVKISETDSEDEGLLAEVQDPAEKEELQSDSGDDMSPEEVQQKLAALGEQLSDENNESDKEEEEPLSPSRVRFDASVSMLESVPEDEDGGSESEEESEGSSVGEAGGKHSDMGNDHDDVTAL
ncbi:hypothetical protein ACHWQZ_G011910 [Mnemiopsis leidyi]